MVDYFSLICAEIATKQNGITLKRGDDAVLREMFESDGGDVAALHAGVLPQFDALKEVLARAYRAGRVAAAGDFSRAVVSVDAGAVVRQIDAGRADALRVARGVLGDSVLAAVLRA